MPALEKLVWAKQNTIKSSTCFRLKKRILYFRCNISQQLIWLASKISSHIKRPSAYQLIHSNLLSNSWRGSGNLITTSTVTRESIRGTACLLLRELGLRTGVGLLLCPLQRSHSRRFFSSLSMVRSSSLLSTRAICSQQACGFTLIYNSLFTALVVLCLKSTHGCGSSATEINEQRDTSPFIDWWSLPKWPLNRLCIHCLWDR